MRFRALRRFRREGEMKSAEHLEPPQAPAVPGPPGSGEFSAMPLAARGFVAGTVALGALAIAIVVPGLTFERPGLFIELLALALLTSTVKLALPLSRSGSTMSLSFALNFASLLMLGTGEALIIGMLSAWTQCTFRMKARNPTHRTLFSIASVGLSIHAAGTVFDLVKMGETGFLLGVVRPLGPATLVYFFVNTFLVATAVSLSTNQTLRKVWVSSFMWSAPSYFIAASAAALAAGIARQGSFWWGLLVALPLYLTYRSYRTFIGRLEEERAQVRQLSDVQLATIEALALAIEVKDRTSDKQVRRMQVYAEGLARALDMPEEEIPGVKTAALLHDIGHLAVPEHILSKAGPLSYEEFERVKIHPKVGADILAMVPFPYPVGPLILSHHERWNGTGYPEGLKETAIPLGARVLAVTDTFTSLLFDRPYRKARSFGEAVSTLRACADVSLDPALVEKFLEILPVLEVQFQNAHDGHLSEAPGVEFGSLGPSALENILGAHNEAKVLYEIAQALGTSLGVEETVNLVAAKLQGLLPFSCYALFLNEGGSGRLTCRVALGTGEREVLHVAANSIDELTHTLPRNATTWETPLHSILVSPLVVGSHTVGAFALYHVSSDAYEHEHRRVMELITRQAAPVIQNALVFEEAQEASLTDPLTGLPNRRALQQHLTKELARAERQHTKVTLLLLDMDGLKYFNDHFGHHMGDRAIREVANVLRPLLRSYDLCARFAGDEFVLALWECDAVQGDLRRMELQNAVAGATIDIGRGKTMPLGISAGASTFPDDASSAEELIGIADKRMYQDKIARKSGGGIAIPMRDQDTPPLKAVG
jgi:diguanylate cyclase (GGDEF)-like protein